MNFQRSCFFRCLLIVLLLGSQWVYADHERELPDQEHHHSADCIVCLSHANTDAATPSLFFHFGLSTAILFSALEPGQPAFAQSLTYPIRAPPVQP